MIIYKVENKVNGKVYIGKTIYDLKTRKPCHLSYAQRGVNTYFHKAIRKYGKENFEWSVLVETDSESKLNSLEKFYIAAYRKMGIVYNMTDGGEGQSGCSPSEETRKKFSELYKGKTISQETKNKISIANKGKIRTDEFKRRLSESRKGLIPSEDVRKKMSDSQKGRKHSTETKNKMSESAKGNTRWEGKHHTEETKLKMSKSSKGRITSELTKKKLSEAHKGKTSPRKGKILSEETKKKISDSKKLSSLKKQNIIEYGI